ncbi:hypothetical protein H4R21_003739, partial [Coemansia helicoidea]
FVHHTVIHNSGGFKSLAESEPVEFEFTRGPKGLQATRVTGPGGAFVRGDPYTRLRVRPPAGAPVAHGHVASAPASAPAQLHHYPLPAGYAQSFPYGAQPAHTAYGSLLPSVAPLPGPPGMSMPPARPAIGDGGLGMTASGVVVTLRSVSSLMQQRYNGISMPVPVKHPVLPGAPSTFDAFSQYPPSTPYGSGIPATFATPAAIGTPQTSMPPPAPVPHFLASTPSGTMAPRTGMPAYNDMPK